MFKIRRRSQYNKEGSKASRRLRDKAGETITETLVALLIASMALVMLAGAITTAKNILQNNRTAFDKYYAANEQLMTRSGSTAASDTITVSDVTSGTAVDLFGTGGVPIVTFTNSTLGTPVTAYKYGTVSSGTSGSD